MRGFGRRGRLVEGDTGSFMGAFDVGSEGLVDGVASRGRSGSMVVSGDEFPEVGSLWGDGESTDGSGEGGGASSLWRGWALEEESSL